MDHYELNPEMPREVQDQIAKDLNIGAPSKVNAKFILGAGQDYAASAELGRPIFVDRIEIIEIPEGVKDYISREATETDKHRYAGQWQRFQEALTASRFPVEQIPGIRPCEVKMLKESGITSIQDAANVTDRPELANAVMKAKRWLAIAAGEKPRVKLEAVA